jgi:hypothetical protein
MRTNPMAAIFISYSRKDLKARVALANDLSKAGYSIWSDEDIDAAADYQQAIHKQLKRSKAVVVIWSRSSVRSEHVRGEAEIARKARKLVPVSVSSLDIGSLPSPFNILHTVPLDDFPQIIAGISRLVWRSSSRLTKKSKINCGFDRSNRHEVSRIPDRPFTRIRVHVGLAGKIVGTELVEANSEALAFYGANNDRSTIIGLSTKELVSRISSWMNPDDFKALKSDQIRAAAEFGEHQWAAARVPVRLNSNHPNPKYRNRVFRPVIQTVQRNDHKVGTVLFAEVSYVEE